MTIIKGARGLDVRNCESLPGGLGCRYLEAMTAHVPGVLIAVQWRRKVPAVLQEGRVLIDFKPEE